MQYYSLDIMLKITNQERLYEALQRSTRKDCIRSKSVFVRTPSMKAVFDAVKIMGSGARCPGTTPVSDIKWDTVCLWRVGDPILFRAAPTKKYFGDELFVEFKVTNEVSFFYETNMDHLASICREGP